jgi:hypothetical protein
MVESPYNTPTRSRLECVRYALWCCLDAERRGEACFASHLFYTLFSPETKEGRDRGLRCRDAIARRLGATIARYADIGMTPGMFRDIDCTATVEVRQLEGDIREAWLSGAWPEGSLTVQERTA